MSHNYHNDKKQAPVSGNTGTYPQQLETSRTTRKGLELFLRPVKSNDEPLISQFYQHLSEQAMYQRFLTVRKNIPREEIKRKYVLIDYSSEMVLLAFHHFHHGQVKEKMEKVVGKAQYVLESTRGAAEISVVVRDDFQGKGIGSELLSYAAYAAQTQGVKDLYAYVMPDNTPVFKLLKYSGLQYKSKFEEGIFIVNIYL